MPKFDALYAFISTDTGPDDEALVGMNTSSGWMPMVGSDMEATDKLKPIAAAVARRLGKPIKLIRFSNREELETITG